MFMLAKEKAAAIRKLLKAKGIKASVITKPSGYSSSIRITIKDLSGDIDEAKKIAREFESIRYDQFSGEILSGGNDYVHVNYDYDTVKAAAVEYLPHAEKLLAELEPGYITTVGENNGKRFLLWPGYGSPHLNALVMQTDTQHHARNYSANSPAELAEGLAIIDKCYKLNLLKTA
jgi:hypothetical protein